MGFLLLAVLAACSESTAPPEPLATEFIGDLGGVSRAQLEAACLARPLPDGNWRYVITALGASVTVRHEDPWPGREDGDVHAVAWAITGPLRFSCTATHRSGTTGGAGGPSFEVEFGEASAPVLQSRDEQVCASDGSGGSNPTAANQGSITCPYDFGRLFPEVADVNSAGSYTFTVEVAGRCSIFRPETLGPAGERHPILLWSNGITLNPNFYAPMLTHFASHGFVVAANDTSRVGEVGTGEDILDCLEYLEGQNETPGSPYEGKLNLYRVGAAGHSAGGGGVIMAGRDPRVGATAPIQPWLGPRHGYLAEAPGQQHGPMFLSSGSDDTEIPPEHHPTAFAAANVPILWATLQGSGHNDPLFSGGAYRGPVTAWFRLHLMLDASGRGLFYGPDCGLCTAPEWVVQKRNGI